VALFAGWQIVGSWALLLLGGFGLAVALAVGRTTARVRLRGARALRYGEAPVIHNMVDNLSRQAELRATPELYVTDSPDLNAATVGSGSDTILVLTTGLLRSLPEREMRGVLAHEIAHIRNGDLTLFRVTETIRQATVMFTRAGWFLLLFSLPFILFGTVSIAPLAVLALLAAPLVSWLIQLAILRTREFAADETAARLAGDPAGLASALVRIEQVRRSFLFSMIVPVTAEQGGLLRTHPTTAERVERLQALGRRRRATTVIMSGFRNEGFSV
jgi:heat shock protein HtpX